MALGIKRWIKKVLWLITGLILILLSLFYILNEPLPEGKTGPDADQLARKMLLSIRKDAWDSTRIVQWSFRSNHHYLWDKERKFLSVKWENNHVLLDLNDHGRGRVFIDNKQDIDKIAYGLKEKALAYFYNDSFWLNAPSKVFDEGTERSLVDLDKGRKGLLITYTSGGITPGDSYLWILGKNGLPKSFKMWVSIIPVGGLEATWENWVTTDSEAIFSTSHRLLFLNIKIENLRTADNYKSMGFLEDPFQILLEE
jgi:hypothetical protein